jgi:N-methylhydantoinase A
MDSTTLILPGHAAAVDPSGSLLIRPAAASTAATAKES